MTFTSPFSESAENIEIQQLKTDIVHGFFAHDVIKVNTTNFFTLSSGLRLPIYLDHRRIYSFPKLREKVTKAWGLMLKQQTKDFYNLSLQENTGVIFSGTATAGIAPAYALSSHFEAGFVYVRDKSKAYGLHSQVEGVVEDHNKFIVVDDMVVTGGSLLKNAQILKGLYGAQSILFATSISCHESATMRQTFEQNSVVFLSLFTTREIFEIAHKNDIIESQTFTILMDCLNSMSH